jgi:DnaJ-class molecular chaperone
MGAMELDRDAYEILQVSPKAHADVIRAAYRALAALYHPDRDGSQMSMRRMAELNAAYAELRSADRRKAYDTAKARRHSTTVTSGVASFRVTPEGGGQRDPEMLDFGRYQGWTVTQLARQDPDYLRWLSRHSSGIRYRARIEKVLADGSRPSVAERVRTR